MAPRKPVILLMSNYSDRTGFAWRNIHQLYSSIGKAFKNRGYEVLVSFATVQDGGRALDDEIDPVVLQVPPPRESIRELLRLAVIARRHRVRAIYMTDQLSLSWRYTVLRLAGVKRIIVHNRISVAGDSDGSGPGAMAAVKRMAKRLRALIPGATPDRIYAVSDFVKKRVTETELAPPERVMTILNGIDVASFADLPKPPDPGLGIFLFAGSRATVHKGIHVLIQALAILRDDHGLEDIQLLYAGDGPYLPELHKLADSLGLTGQVRFLGQTRGVRDAMSKAHIVVVPSVWADACPSAVSEGLASGRPLVATAVGGIPQMVGDDANAILVPPDDPGALAEAIGHLIRNPNAREGYARRGQKRARSALGVERYHAEVVNDLLRVVER